MSRRDISLTKSNSAGARRASGVFRAGCVGCVLAAVLLLCERGVLRALEGSWDFTMIYAGSRQLVLGDDPYDFDATYDTFEAAGGTGRPRDPEWFASLYPPFTYALLAPVGLLQWSGAKWAWLIANTLATAAVATWLVRHRPHRAITSGTPGTPGTPGADGTSDRAAVSPWTAALACAVWLACGSLHTAIAFGQLCVVTLALMLPLLGPRTADEKTRWRGWGTRSIVAGVMLAAAGLLKPQLVAPLALVLLFSHRRAAVLWCIAGGILFVMASGVWVQSVAPQWWANWQGQLSAFAATGFADPTASNPFTYQMVNLEPWLHRLWPGGSGPRGLLGAVALGLPSVALLWAIVQLVRSRRSDHTTPHNAMPDEREPEDALLLVLSFTCVLTLLLVYHRAYDAVLLVVPGLWAWRVLVRDWRDRAGHLTLACLAFFMVPGPPLLSSLLRHGVISAGAADLWLWRTLVMPHQNIALVVLAVTLGLRVARLPTPTNRVG